MPERRACRLRPTKTTRIDYTFNLSHRLVLSTPAPAALAPAADPDTSPADPEFTLSVMRECRAALHPQCILDNHALQCPPPAPDAFVYAEMLEKNKPSEFQTASPAVIQLGLIPAVETGAYYGASAIELWPGAAAGYLGFTSLSPSLVRQLAGYLEQPPSQMPSCALNPTPSPSPSSTPP